MQKFTPSYGAPLPSGRRGFLKAATAAVLGLGALLTAPLAGLRAWLQPLREAQGSEAAQGDWILVARLSALPEDRTPRRFPVIADQVNAWSRMPRVTVGAVWLCRASESGNVQAFNVVCPHAGCLVDYTPERHAYLCPCHDSRFGLDGRVESGNSPSPRGLDSLEAEVRDDDEVWVRFQSFRPGIKERVPV